MSQPSTQENLAVIICRTILENVIDNIEEKPNVIMIDLTKSPKSDDDDVEIIEIFKKENINVVAFHEAPDSQIHEEPIAKKAKPNESASSAKSHSWLSSSGSGDSNYFPESSQSESSSPKSIQEEISTSEMQELKKDKKNYGARGKKRKMKTKTKPKPKMVPKKKKIPKKTTSSTSKREKNEDHELYERRKYIKENQEKYKCQEDDCSIRPSFALFENYRPCIYTIFGTWWES